MDDVSSETCFDFIKKYRKNELQKHRVVHQSDKYIYIYIYVFFLFFFVLFWVFFVLFLFLLWGKSLDKIRPMAEEWFPTRV